MANRFKQTIPMGNPPRTVDEAVLRLISELSLKEKVKIAKMERWEVPALHVTLGPHIREKYGFWSGNEELMESCRVLSGKEKFDMAIASAMIIDAMWARLRRTHTIRSVK